MASIASSLQYGAPASALALGRSPMAQYSKLALFIYTPRTSLPELSQPSGRVYLYPLWLPLRFTVVRCFDETA